MLLHVNGSAREIDAPGDMPLLVPCSMLAACGSPRSR